MTGHKRKLKAPFEALRPLMKLYGYDDDWEVLENGTHLLRQNRGGAVVSWFPTTRTILCQGQEPARSELEEKLEAAFAWPRGPGLFDDPAPATETKPQRRRKKKRSR